MGALGIIGGIGKGISAGVQDLERMDREKREKELHAFQKEQQAKTREGWESDKELARRLKEVKTTQEGWGPGYDATSAAPLRDEEGNVMPGVAQVARPEHEVTRERAGIYSGTGRREDLGVGLQLGTAADVQQKKFKFEQAMDLGRKEYAAMQADPINYLVNKSLPIYNDKINDGISGKIEEYGGKKYIVSRLADGTPAGLAPQELTPENAMKLNHAFMEQLQRQRLGEVDENNFWKGQEFGATERERESMRTHREKTLGLNRAELEAKLPLMSAQAQEAYAKAGYYGRMPAEKSQTAVQAKQEMVEWYAKALLESGEAKTPQEARTMALRAAVGDTQKNVSVEDASKIIEQFGDKPSGEIEPKTGAPVLVKDLSAEKQMAFANRVAAGLRGRERSLADTGGGYAVPDATKGGTPAQARASLTAPPAAASTAPPPLGVPTPARPMSVPTRRMETAEEREARLKKGQTPPSVRNPMGAPRSAGPA